jgi:hypothetical protein
MNSMADAGAEAQLLAAIAGNRSSNWLSVLATTRFDNAEAPKPPLGRFKRRSRHPSTWAVIETFMKEK